MIKKIRIERWELIYTTIFAVIFGFWVGYILGGSSSRFSKPEVRDELIINVAVIMSLMAIIQIIIKIIINFMRKLEIQKKSRMNFILLFYKNQIILEF